MACHFLASMKDKYANHETFCIGLEKHLEEIWGMKSFCFGLGVGSGPHGQSWDPPGADSGVLDSFAESLAEEASPPDCSIWLARMHCATVGS